MKPDNLCMNCGAPRTGQHFCIKCIKSFLKIYECGRDHPECRKSLFDQLGVRSHWFARDIDLRVQTIEAWSAHDAVRNSDE